MSDSQVETIARAPDWALRAMREALVANDLARLEGLVRDFDTSCLGALPSTAFAVDLKEAGHPELALVLLMRVVACHPGFGAARYELAVLHRLGDRPRDAIRSLLALRECDADHARGRLLLGHMLHAVGAHREATAALGPDMPAGQAPAGQSGAGQPGETDVAVMHDFGRYLAVMPRHRAHYLLDEVARRYDWLSTADVASRIGDAIARGTGFSLVRLGDGEGAYARIGAADEDRHRVLYAWLRREWARLLYGAGFDPVATGYDGLASTLMDTACRADIVGVPYRAWIDHEYAISSVRGIPCLMNIHRHLLGRDAASGPAPALCDQRIHTRLHEEGLLAPLLRRARRLAVVSCIPDLGPRVGTHFGIEDVEVFRIPGERYTASLRTEASVEGAHFPFVYWNIVERLSRPLEGRVFLIAAGTLAKFYADVIKRHGGVALDIGSLADGWMRIGSRPGYGPRLELDAVESGASEA